MKNLLILCLLLLTVAAPAMAIKPHEKANLIGTWVLEGMSEKLDGERIPDGAFYEFTRDGKLNYEMSGFKQSGTYKIKGKKILTDQMGTYKVISIKSDEMILHYGGYMFFKKKP